MKKSGSSISKSKCAVKAQPISGRAIYIGSKTCGAQRSGGVCTREKRSGSGFLDCNVKTKNRRVLLSKDTEHDARRVHDRNRHPRIAAEWLANRSARDVRLLRGA